MSEDNRQVLVIHGRNTDARDALFTFLRSIGLNPIEWNPAIEMTGEASPHIWDVLDVAFGHAQAIVVLLTPDEITYLRSEYVDSDSDAEIIPSTQARPNVLFEAGIAMGRDHKRTVLVEFGKVRPFSDVAGRHTIRLDNTPEKRLALAQRLRTAGCEVNTAGSDWLSAGDLTPPPPPGHGLPLGKKVPPASTRRLTFDLQYQNRGNGSRLQLINRGTETAYDVNLLLPPEAEGLILFTNELPLSRLPSGKSHGLPATRAGGGGKDCFDVRVTARSADGVVVEEDVFLSLTG
jgi:Predicted nucleotide-binding protein containing TIR-like domain